MPLAAKRPCTHVGCGVLVQGGSRCDRHPIKAWVKPAHAVKRITGRRLQALRAELFKREPLCRRCRQAGRVTVATQRDHIVSVEDGGDESDENTQALCARCHSEKSKGEAARGRWGGYREGRGGSKV